ncbi:MAG: type II secretion system minor pseudopilin GspK [Ramlibacter sp.]|nr:type II secretion system minor pseudopilin GspK [Ramlibacter sp.]
MIPRPRAQANELVIRIAACGRPGSFGQAVTGLGTPHGRRRQVVKPAQRGAALLMAMLIVALVATFASAAMWQQWRSVEVEQAERARVQSAWVLTGALDWARLILREDARSGGADHLAEPWAVPLEESRLSSFLAADKANTADAADTMNAFLSGQITDLQSLLNVNNLVEEGQISEPGLRSFSRLFETLSLPPAQLGLLVENLRFAADTSPDNRSAVMAPLMPQRVEQLVWLGLPVQTVAVLQPYVTVLPGRTPVNLNTASAQVIAAAVSGLSLADAQRLVSQRVSAPFRSINDASKLVPGHEAAFTEGGVGVASRFFEVRGRLRLDQMVVEERSVLRRDGLDVKTLQRERGVLGATAQSTAVKR